MIVPLSHQPHLTQSLMLFWKLTSFYNDYHKEQRNLLYLLSFCIRHIRTRMVLDMREREKKRKRDVLEENEEFCGCISSNISTSIYGVCKKWLHISYMYTYTPIYVTMLWTLSFVKSYACLFANNLLLSISSRYCLLCFAWCLPLGSRPVSGFAVHSFPLRSLRNCGFKLGCPC